MILGLDTSNYTTSCALFDGIEGVHVNRLLPVKEGTLGLRQSDAVFHHIRALPELMESLFQRSQPDCITGIGVSIRPRRVEGSYMPCFLVGESVARSLAAAKGVPLFSFSHQEGHIAAALWSAERMDLFDQPHLAWHLSGGTTELLLVKGDQDGFQAEIIGGTKDISAGQLIDRAGKKLGLSFPAGKELDTLAQTYQGETLSVKGGDLFFSLSGMENKINGFVEAGEPAPKAASFTLDIIVTFIAQATCLAQQAYPGLPVVFSGGVASNSRLRSRFQDAIFAKPEFSTDNAMGTAILGHRMLTHGAML